MTSTPEPSCETCDGRGWVPVEDPLIPDALIDARCLTCSSDSANVWLDSGWWVHPDGTRRLLSWNAASHELKFWAVDRRDKDLVLAVIDTEAEVVRRLEGYADHCDTKEGLSWLAQRLEGCR